MDSLPVVILVDSNIVVKNRIRRLLSEQEINIYEAFNRQELLKILDENKYQVDLIITDIEIDTDSNFDGISLIKLVKSKSDMIPVVVLTSTGNKEVILKYLYEGTADYILKPVTDTYLKERISKYLRTDSLTEFTVLKFSLKQFLESELYKAKKGSYMFTLLKISFLSYSDDSSKQLSNEFYKYSKSVYEAIKSVFWDSDVYIQHGYHCHLGFIPFCSHENTNIINNKIITAFDAFRQTHTEMQNYSITQAYSTYPTNGESVNELLEALEARNMESQ